METAEAVTMETQIRVHIIVPHKKDVNIDYIIQPDLKLKAQVGPVCERLNIEPDDYRFGYQKDKKDFYYTEENRDMIKDGDTIYLFRSPTLLALDCKDNLDSFGKTKALDDLTRLISDLYFAQKFYECEGVNSLLRVIESGHYNGVHLGRALKIVSTFFLLDIKTTDLSFSEDFLKRVCAEIHPEADTDENVGAALGVLEIAARQKPDLVATLVKVSHLVHHFGVADEDSITRAIIELVNTILEKARSEISRKFVDALAQVGPEFEKMVLKYPKGYARTTEYENSLFRFQVLCLRVRYLHLYNDTNDLLTNGPFNEFMARVLRSELGSRSPHTERYLESMKNIGGAPEEYEDILRPGEKYLIRVRELDALTVECLIYFEKQHKSVMSSWLREVKVLPMDYICPLLKSAILLTDLIVELLYIKDTPPETGGRSLRIFFINIHLFLEDFFCLGLKLVLKTWREMRARSCDLLKVFHIVREQLSKAVSSEFACWSFQELQSTLNAMPYNAISQQLMKDQIRREDSEKQALLIQLLSAKIWGLVKECKLIRLIEGLEFQRIKQKNRSSVIRLSHDRRQLRLIVENRSDSIPIDDITKVSVMKQCPHHKKEDFSISIHTTAQERSVHLATTDKLAFEDLWDGINALQGNKLESTSAAEDFNKLMDLELKHVLLELDDIIVPKDEIPIPEDPENYNFRSSGGGCTF